MDGPHRRFFRLRFTRSRIGEVDEEFAFHLTERARELEARGLTPEQARRETLRQFGDIDEARQSCRAEDDRRMREYRWALLADNVRQDVSLALRAMRRQPAFTVSSVLTLGVAIGIAAAAYGVLHAYLVRPLPYPDPERLVYLIPGPSRQLFPNAPSLSRVDWAAVDSVFAETVRWDLDGFTLAGGDRPEYVDGAWVSAGFFNALGMRPAVGRAFAPEEFRTVSPVAIISDELWSRRYGRDPSIIGRTVRAHSTDRPNDNESVTIVGVMPAGVWHITRFTQVLRPLATPRMISMALLKPGQSIGAAQARVNAIVLPQLGRVDSTWRTTLTTVQEEYTYRVRPTLVALLGAAIFLLLIGGASVAGAQTARTAARRVELQVRSALGATRSRIMVQLLVESLTTAAAAAVLGAAIAVSILAGLSSTIASQLGAGVPGGAQQLSLSIGILALVSGGGALVGVVFGLIPAASAVRASGSIGAIGAIGAHRGGSASVASPALRRGMMVAQIGCTMMLLVGAGLMGRTMLAIGSTPLGFDATNVVKGDLLFPQSRYPNEPTRRIGNERVLTNLRSKPGILAAAAAAPHPFRNAGQPQPIAAEASARENALGARAMAYVITDGYFDVMGIALRRGRSFGPQDDATSVPSVVISEQLGRELWPRDDAIGRRLRLGEDTLLRTVVGIVADTRESVEAVQAADIYLPFVQSPRSYVSILVRVNGDPGSAGAMLRRAVAETDDILALAEVEPMADVVFRDSQRHRALTTVLSAFGGFALGIAMLGLYASLAFMVAQRRREIAIRVAIGADPGRIRGLVLREGMIVVLFGVGLGGLLSVAMTRVLSTQLQGGGVTATDPATFAAIAGILGVAALAAAASPIRRAASVQPAEALRAE